MTECVKKAIKHVETTAYDPNGPLRKCHCMPACSEIEYPFSITQVKLDSAKSLQLSSELITALPQLDNDSFVKENLALVHIYHENLHFLKLERGEVR